MSILTLDQIRTESLTKIQNVSFLKTNLTKTEQGFGKLIDYWTCGGQPIAGSNPTTATGSIFNINSTGALKFRAASSGSSLYLKDINIASSWINAQFATSTNVQHSIGQGTIHIWDRLWANGSLTSSASVSPTYTNNAPDLTRYTTGEGLSLWFKLNTRLGTGAGTVTGTITYYNQNNELKSTTFIYDTKNNVNGIFEVVPVPLASGDSGIRKLETSNVTTSAGTTTHGFFIAKYYGAFKFNHITSFSNNNFSYLNGLNKVDNDACLTFALHFPGNVTYSAAYNETTNTSNLPNVSGNLVLIEG